MIVLSLHFRSSRRSDTIWYLSCLICFSFTIILISSSLVLLLFKYNLYVFFSYVRLRTSIILSFFIFYFSIRSVILRKIKTEVSTCWKLPYPYIVWNTLLKFRKNFVTSSLILVTPSSKFFSLWFYYCSRPSMNIFQRIHSPSTLNFNRLFIVLDGLIIYPVMMNKYFVAESII